VGGARVATNYPYNDGISQVDSTHIEADIPFQGYDEAQAWKSQGDVLTFSAEGRSQIRKPIIVLDGFDPDDTRNAWSIYKERFKYKDEIGIETRLGDELRRNNPDNGHDVLILNFPVYVYTYAPVTFCPKYENNGGCIKYCYKARQTVQRRRSRLY
jgi:hypothetical protein